MWGVEWMLSLDGSCVKSSLSFSGEPENVVQKQQMELHHRLLRHRHPGRLVFGHRGLHGGLQIVMVRRSKAGSILMTPSIGTNQWN